ncbi:hypothetical protein DH2020_019269 [Rehmannia glutinosa]|uniref:Serine/threonine-protein phosphatase 2A 55 kDa regulatory subunit B n=1 Tax=Rehmannia glutinosa TaxID=99300 RepID=A0ABR0WLI8_REHGL
MSLSFGSDSSSSPAALEWRFSQVFGDKLPGEDVQDSNSASLHLRPISKLSFTELLILRNVGLFFVCVVDVISAIEFDKNGNHLAVGDRGGRVVIFQSNGGKDDLLEFSSRHELEQLDSVVLKHPKFQYKTEFQSHEPEFAECVNLDNVLLLQFDYLKSIEIEEKINKNFLKRDIRKFTVRFGKSDRSTVDNLVKDHVVKRVKEMDISQSVSSENSLLAEKSFIHGQKSKFSNGHSLEWSENKVNGVSSYNGGHNEIACLEDATLARCRRVYAHAHDFNVNSISVNSDWETFLSGDDLRINLWNLEVSNQCFNIIDMKPANMEDLIEVITAAEFHPFHCNLLAYSSSRGFIRLVDMRKSALCDHNARILKDEESHGPKSFFTEIIASITDMKFANDGRHILSRDYMNLKLYIFIVICRKADTLHYAAQLCDLYNNDAIFDKFECCVAKDRLSFATGSYSNLLRVFSCGSGSEGVTIEASRNTNRKPHVQTTSRPRRSSLSNLARGFYRQGHDNQSAGSNEFSYDFNSKLLHLAWHPTTNLIACAAGNSLFIQPTTITLNIDLLLGHFSLAQSSNGYYSFILKQPLYGSLEDDRFPFGSCFITTILQINVPRD